MEGGGGEHLELELAVAVDELGVGEEVEPVLDDFIEGAEQALPLLGAALEELLGLALPLVAEVLAEQVGHLPAVAHLLAHHPHEGKEVVVARGALEEGALLLHRGELGVALEDDQVQQGVPDALVGNVHQRRPLRLPLVMAELDGLRFRLAELGLETNLPERRPRHLLLRDADRVLPVVEVVDPVVEVVDFPHVAPHPRVVAVLNPQSAPPPSRSPGPRRCTS